VLNKTYSLPVKVSLNDSNIFVLDVVNDKESTLKYFTSAQQLVGDTNKPSTKVYKTKFHSFNVQEPCDTSSEPFVKPKYHSVKVRQPSNANNHDQNSNHSSSSSRKLSIKKFKQRELFKVNQSLPNLIEDLCPESEHSEDLVDTIDCATKQLFQNQTDCDIDLIEMFSVHQYDCKQELWEQWYGHGDSKFVNGVSNKLGEYGGKKDWKEYLQSKPFWVTETSCYHDMPDLSKPGTYERPHASSKEMCLRISGQRPKTYGIGSIATMERLDTIDRYAFWTTWSPKKKLKPVNLTYKDGTITPVGRAYLNPGDTSINCEFPGKVIKVDDKQTKLQGGAKMISCASTGGTAMVRKLHLGNVSFTVKVQKAGDYALNISYMSKETRPLYVKVNDQKKAQRFFFPDTGGWCFENGKTTVVPMELSGFSKGENTITFGNVDETGEVAPMIEWISVVM